MSIAFQAGCIAYTYITIVTFMAIALTIMVDYNAAIKETSFEPNPFIHEALVICMCNAVIIALLWPISLPTLLIEAFSK